MSPVVTLLGLLLVDCALSWTSCRVWSSSDPFFKSKSRATSSCSSRHHCTTRHAVTRSKLVLESGKSATIRSRLVTITPTWNVTAWEWDEPATVMENYWSAQSDFVSRKHLLDPFGLVSWPGSVVAAQEMLKYRKEIQNSTVLVLGAGPGVEAQAVAMTGAKDVIATDIHPTTLQLLRYGAQQAGLDHIIQGQVFDVCSDTPLPECDIMIAADVLYNEYLASHVRNRCQEAIRKGTKILVTDSQRFTDLLPELNRHLDDSLTWDERQLDSFTGSGVMVNEDQTYNVTVRVLAVGW